MFRAVRKLQFSGTVLGKLTEEGESPVREKLWPVYKET